MALRGLLYRKLKAATAKKPMPPELQKQYNQAYQAEINRREKARKQAQIANIKARAKADAARAATPKGKRVMGGLVTAGRAFGKKLDKIDMDKFEAHVTGVSTSKKKR